MTLKAPPKNFKEILVPTKRKATDMPLVDPAQPIPPVLPVLIQNSSLTVTASPDKPLPIAWPAQVTWAKVFQATKVSTSNSFKTIWSAPANAAYRVIVRDFPLITNTSNPALRIGAAQLKIAADPTNPSTHQEFVVCDGETIDFKAWNGDVSYYIQVIRIAG